MFYVALRQKDISTQHSFSPSVCLLGSGFFFFALLYITGFNPGENKGPQPGCSKDMPRPSHAIGGTAPPHGGSGRFTICFAVFLTARRNLTGHRYRRAGVCDFADEVA